MRRNNNEGVKGVPAMHEDRETESSGECRDIQYCLGGSINLCKSVETIQNREGGVQRQQRMGQE